METPGPTVAHRFAAAFNAQEIDALVGCFAPDAGYRDLFHGTHTGHAQLRALFAGMFREGRHRWTMNSVVSGPRTTIGEWTFTMRARSRAAGTAGGVAVLRYDGVSVFETRDGLCHGYREFFDRTAVLFALGISPAGVARLVAGEPAVEVLEPT